ncbi:MAG: diacylglycerol kinase [Woeseiaceae bacterium]|jgi:diacylglycerol kinase (ATP)|nr:diacylglycerol kinase [Woeseiaceae bacterium]MDG1015274.1 diacylglycerol kinase [Woeseiaceae bacterium]MDG1712617.1 diacylglycerol kinase [Woeseiaceae bacterium]MDG1866099.1 diacylglycerol kinase [Woeseiaceae bacterium]
MSYHNKYKKQGLTRVTQAFVNSGKGFYAAWINESAYRQELYLFITLSIIAILLPIEISHKFILILSMLPVLAIELINSAIESIVDRISMDEHELSARAKDMGSAAVFISLMIVILVWCFILWKNFGTSIS